MRQRLFAWLLARFAEAYERRMEARKRLLFRSISFGATVVEIGPGTGTNLRYLPQQIRYVGLEPNQHMHPYLREAAIKSRIDAELQAIPLEAAAESYRGQADFVISSLVLCSVADRAQALAAVHEILKPGGAFLFLEHVGAGPESDLRRWQDRLAKPWKWSFDGCQLNNDTQLCLESLPWHKLQLEQFDSKLGPIAPHIVGIAHKAD
jgi:SAM-dependent methyltransferase